MKKEKSCGAVIYRENDGIEILLLKHKNGGHWAFPKGHVEKKETDEEKGKNYLYKESGELSATRGVFLKDAATTGLTAKLEGGILTVNVPKQDEKANVTKIAID